tara:strand:+ start:4144 stop:5730 length:1587 start_codon:yes stop_codon:yes gene_type:complete
VNVLDRIVTDNQGRELLLLEPTSLNSAPEDFQLSRVSKPFTRYFSLVANSLIMLFLVQAFSAQLMGILDGEPLYVIGCSFVTFPCIGFLIFLHRPKLIEVRLLTADENGMYAHPLPEGGSIQTPNPTKMNRFLVRDDSVIDTPPSFWIWIIFAVCLCISFVISVIEIIGGDLGMILSLVMALPMTIILFSIPVYAWWASSTSWIGLPTRLRDAESWLIAGMAAGIPAILINSWLTPNLVPSAWSTGTEEFIIYTFSAPIGEEIFKFLAVACFISSIKGPKTGFQVGFTVGLGFAIVENLIYLVSSYVGGGFTSLFITSLIRGIGSIPGHAVWTSFSGAALGWWVSDPKNKAKIILLIQNLSSRSMNIIESIGIDVDMDGDMSGFDGVDYTMLTALEEAKKPSEKVNWTVSTDKSDKILTSLIDESSKWWIIPEKINQNKSTVVSDNSNLKLSIIPPKSVILGLLIAIVGHSLWNGSGIVLSEIGRFIGLNENLIVLLTLLWIIILVIVVLLVSTLVMRGVSNIPDTSN